MNMYKKKVALAISALALAGASMSTSLITAHAAEVQNQSVEGGIATYAQSIYNNLTVQETNGSTTYPIENVTPVVAYTTLVASTTELNEGHVEYQWYRTKTTKYPSSSWKISDSDTEIPGATGSSYTISKDDFGYKVYVVMKGKDGYTGAVNSFSTMISVRPTNTDGVGVTNLTWDQGIGNLRYGEYVGDKLQATVDNRLGFSYAEIDESNANIRWYRDTADSNGKSIGSGDSFNSDDYTNFDDKYITSTSELIPGANSFTYTLTQDDVGKYVYAVVTDKDDTAVAHKSKSVCTTMVKAKISSISIEKYVGVGDTLTLTTDIGDIDFKRYRWYRSDSTSSSGSQIDGADSKTYTVTEDDLGKYIRAYASSAPTNYEYSAGYSNWTAIVGAEREEFTVSLVNEKNTSEKTKDIEVKDGDIINLDDYTPDTVDGFKFIGWVDSSTGQTITGEVTVTGDMTFTAKWEKVENSNTGDNGNTGANTGKDDNTSGDRIPTSKENVDYTTLETDEVFGGAKKPVKVYVSQGQDVAVQLPFKLVLDGKKGADNKADFKVQVRANIAGNDNIKVIPETEFTMSTTGKKDIKGDITIEQTEFNIAKDGEQELALGKIINGKAQAYNLSAGHWEGGFAWTISAESTKIKDSTESTEDTTIQALNLIKNKIKL